MLDFANDELKKEFEKDFGKLLNEAKGLAAAINETNAPLAETILKAVGWVEANSGSFNQRGLLGEIGRLDGLTLAAAAFLYGEKIRDVGYRS